MAREIEAKILEIDREQFVEQLQALDPETVTSGSVFNWFYKGAPNDATVRAIRYRQTSDASSFSPTFFSDMKPGALRISFPEPSNPLGFTDLDFPALTLSSLTDARAIFAGLGFKKKDEQVFEAPSGCRLSLSPFETADEQAEAVKRLQQSDYVLAMPELTVKKTPENAVQGLKDLDEWSFVTDDAMTLFVMLQSMGLSVKSNDQLERTVYTFPGGITAHIDEITGIPTFAEIEAPTKEDVYAFAKKLGYSPDQLSDLGIGALRELYKTKKA